MCFGGDPEIKETALEKETARIAMEKYDYLKPQLDEAEKFYFDETLSMNDAENYTKLKKDIGVTTHGAFDNTSRAVASNLAANDVDPTSGKYQNTLKAVADNAGGVASDAINKGQSAWQDSALTGVSNLVARGEGESAKAIDGMMEIADTSSRYARHEASTEAQRNANRNGTLAFLAGSAYESANGGG